MDLALSIAAIVLALAGLAGLVATRKNTKNKGDAVVKSDSAEFRSAVTKGVDERLAEKARADKAAADAKSERDAARKARKKFSEPWVCPKCGSDESAVAWTGQQKVPYNDPCWSDPRIYRTWGLRGSSYELVDLDVLDVKCERCGYGEQLNPLDAK